MRAHICLMSCLFCPTAVLAQVGNTMAVHPLAVVEVSEREEIELRKVFIAEVARLEKNLVEAAKVRAFLKTIPHRTCAAAVELNDCLAQMARATGAKRAMLVSLRMDPQIYLSGRIVRENGEVRVSAQREFAKPTPKARAQSVRRALRQFLATDMFLGLPDLPSLVSPPVAAAPERKPIARSEPPPPFAGTPPRSSAPTNPPSLTVPPQPSREEQPMVMEMSYERSAWKKTVGYGLVGAGAIAGGLGVYFRIKSSSTWKDFNASSGYLMPSEVQSLNDLKSRAESQGRAGTILLVGGGVALASGITLLILDHNQRESGGSVRLIPQLRGIAVAGTFR